MKAGDLVRFWRVRYDRHTINEEAAIGLLLEYHSWEKVARILYKGEIVITRGENVEKAGKKDFESR